MSTFNAQVLTSTLKHDDVLADISYSNWRQSYPAPETTGVADAVNFSLGQLVCFDDVSGKLRKYVTADTEKVEGIVAETYDGATLNSNGDPAGIIILYLTGAFARQQGGNALANQKIFTDTGVSATVDNKVALNSADVSACRDRGMLIV